MNMVSGFIRQGSCNTLTLCSSTIGSCFSFRSLTHGMYPSGYCRGLIHGMYFSACHVTGQVIGVPHDNMVRRSVPGCGCNQAAMLQPKNLQYDVKGGWLLSRFQGHGNILTATQ